MSSPPKLGPHLASGRTAEVYTWGQGQVLKLFHDWFELDTILFEQKVARLVHSSGIPAPAVGEVVQVNGHNGLVYQRVDGIPMWEVLAHQPWRIFHLAQRTADLHTALHALTAPAEFPDQVQRLRHKIQRAQALPDDLRRQVLAVLEHLPSGDRICHGDFHPGNILMMVRGEVVIDWIDVTRGNPLADLARTTILALGAAATKQAPQVMVKVSLRLFHWLYLRSYFHLRPGGYKEYLRWLPVVAAARLSENIPELQPWLLVQAGGHQ